MKERQFLCRDCRVANKVIYPVDDEEICPHKPEYEVCPHCGERMLEVATGPIEPWPELLALREAQRPPKA